MVFFKVNSQSPEDKKLGVIRLSRHRMTPLLCNLKFHCITSLSLFYSVVIYYANGLILLWMYNCFYLSLFCLYLYYKRIF